MIHVDSMSSTEIITHLCEDVGKKFFTFKYFIYVCVRDKEIYNLSGSNG
jgi:hypothetical protein